MPRPKRPLPPEIGKIPDRLVALAEADRGYHTSADAIRKLRERRGIKTEIPKGRPRKSD
jgi:hypothetical protein